MNSQNIYTVNYHLFLQNFYDYKYELKLKNLKKLALKIIIYDTKT
jgi:hypothetical protein